MTKTLRPVTHVIFDMDGVLLNTEDLYTRVYKQICAEYGKNYEWDLKLKLMGKKPFDAAKQVISALELPLSPEEWIERIKRDMEPVFPEAKLLPGVMKLVEHLKMKNIPIAICTGSAKHGFQLKSTHHKEFFDLFGHITLCGDDPEVKHGKPHPDAYIIANSRFSPSPPPEDVLVIEDAPNGVVAAVKAGMQVVMVPDPNVPEEMRKDATIVLNSLTEFRPEDFGLPPFE